MHRVLNMPKNRSAVLTIAVLACCAVLPADTLTLRNGTAVEGVYLGGSSREIRIEVGDKIQTFPIDSVTGVQFESSTRPQAEAPRAPQTEAPRSPQLLPQPSPEPQYSSSSSNTSSNSPANRGGVELPAGTQLTVRMVDSVDSEVARMGDTFRASLDEPVIVNGESVVPRGADVVAKLVDDQRSGKIQGRTVLKLVLTSITVDGRQVEVTTQDVIKESSSRGARSGKVIGGTAALGAIIGGIAGGGRGAAIGAGSGAAVGTGAQELGKAQRVKIPSETRLVFTLSYTVRA